MERLLMRHDEYYTITSSSLCERMDELSLIRDREDKYLLCSTFTISEDRHIYGKYNLLACNINPDFDF